MSTKVDTSRSRWRATSISGLWPDTFSATRCAPISSCERRNGGGQACGNAVILREKSGRCWRRGRSICQRIGSSGSIKPTTAQELEVASLECATRPPLWPAGMAEGNRANVGPRVGLSSHGSPPKGGTKSKCLARVKIARTSAGPPSLTISDLSRFLPAFGPVPLSSRIGPVPLSSRFPLPIMNENIRDAAVDRRRVTGNGNRASEAAGGVCLVGRGEHQGDERGRPNPASGVSSQWGQTEFQVNLKLGLTPRTDEAAASNLEDMVDKPFESRSVGDGQIALEDHAVKAREHGDDQVGKLGRRSATASSWRSPPGWGHFQPHSGGRTLFLLILLGCGFAALGSTHEKRLYQP